MQNTTHLPARASNDIFPFKSNSQNLEHERQRNAKHGGLMRRADKRLSLRIIYDVDGWAFHNRALALEKYAPEDFDVSIASIRGTPNLEAALGDEPVDVVYLMDRSKLAKLQAILEERQWNPRIVVNWSNGWPMRLPIFYQLIGSSDLVLINNKVYWETTGELPGTYFMPNGVDREIFNVTRPIADRSPRVLWVGSELRRKLKGYDDYLIPLQGELEKTGIPYDFRLVDSYSDKKATPEQMADWYNSGTILVCASEMEGTPNPALEAAACGCVIVSTAVGNMPELIRKGVNGYIVKRDTRAILRGIRSATKKYPKLAEKMQRDIAKWDWQPRSEIFYNLLRKVCDPKVNHWKHSKSGPTYRPRRQNTWSNVHGKFAVETDVENRPDLSHALTVFVTSIGESSFKACLYCLEQQDVRFRLDILENVAPLSEAFRRMVAGCETPFFVQVDEDMLLYPSALRTLYERIVKCPPSTAFHSAAIHDVHLGRLIHGVKIFRHSIIGEYPVGDDEAWYRERNRRLELDGYLLSRDSLVTNGTQRANAIGCHGAIYSDAAIFERYASLQRRQKHDETQGLEWFSEYPQEFLQRFLNEPTDLNYFALMGVIAGSLDDGNQARRAKNYLVTDVADGYDSARKLIEEIRATRG